MSSHLLLIFAFAVFMTSQWSLVNAFSRLTTRQFDSPMRQAESARVCKNYMESCVPWETTCCHNMVCMNLARGYCLYPLEKCLCQKTLDVY